MLSASRITHIDVFKFSIRGSLHLFLFRLICYLYRRSYYCLLIYYAAASKNSSKSSSLFNLSRISIGVFVAARPVLGSGPNVAQYGVRPIIRFLYYFIVNITRLPFLTLIKLFSSFLVKKSNDCWAVHTILLKNSFTLIQLKLPSTSWKRIWLLRKYRRGLDKNWTQNSGAV